MAEHWKGRSQFSLSGDVSNPPGHIAVQPAAGDAAVTGGLDWVISRRSFHPRQFSDSVIAQPLGNDQGHFQPDLVPQSPVQANIECSQGWDIHHLYLCQYLTTLIVKYFFLISNLHQPSFGFKPFLLALSQQALLKFVLIFLTSPL